MPPCLETTCRAFASAVSAERMDTNLRIVAHDIQRVNFYPAGFFNNRTGFWSQTSDGNARRSRPHLKTTHAGSSKLCSVSRKRETGDRTSTCSADSKIVTNLDAAQNPSEFPRINARSEYSCRERFSYPPGADLFHRFVDSGIELFSGDRLGLLGELVKEGAFRRSALARP